MTTFEELKQAGYKAGHEAAIAAVVEIIDAHDDAAGTIKTKIEEIMKDLRPQERRKVLRKLRKEMSRKKRDIDAKHETATKEIERLQEMERAFVEINSWAMEGKFTLERPSGSLIHQLRQDIIDGTALVFHKRDKFTYGQADDYETEVFGDCQIFVVEHDWAGAFANAGDYDEGTEFHLPFETCVFEFSVNNHRVALTATEMDGTIFYETAAKTQIGWFLLGMAIRMDKVDESEGTEGWAKLINFLVPQVKAICVALEAEVAETEVTRAPHRLNLAREKMGRVALSDYHIISLAHRRRYTQLPSTPSDEPKTQKRLHFRRGHWRHFETFKTWVRWTLVGNPDLGFVDKDYRL